MALIKIKTAFEYKSVNAVLIGGEIEGEGGFKKGDVLCNINKYDEVYTVKGIALLKPKKDVSSMMDVQLESGNYSVDELVGKTLMHK